MALYDTDKKLIPPTEHTEALTAGAKVAEQWRKDHENDITEILDPETGLLHPIPKPVGRTEEMVIETDSFTVRQFSDGTIRTDSRKPPAPPPAKVTAETEWRYSPEDLAQLRSQEGKATVQVTEKGMKVSGPAVEVPSRQTRDPWEPRGPYVPRSD